jgi:hypothetical protein
MKKRASSFIAVLPVMIACATPPPTNPPPQEPISTNPPMSEPASTPTTLGAPLSKPPEPEPKPLTPQFPPTQYSKREKSDGKCYVQIYANPPYQAEVSCKAPIEPPTGDSKWCTVQSAKDKNVKVNVLCETK